VIDRLLIDSAAHVLVADLDEPETSTESMHHLLRVLRLRYGAALTLTDGRGAWCSAELVGEQIKVDGPRHTISRPEPPITIGFALTKGERPEWVIQKLTELGVDRIVPFQAARSVVRWSEAKAADQRDRWRRIATGALQQSKGVWLPEIDPVRSWSEASTAVEGPVVQADFDGPSLDLGQPCVFVGPEGGWDPTERSEFPSVGLGDRVLRAETATIFAAGLLVDLRQRHAGRPSAK
jgi:16S rRNA (uracil1498-N3)-methyltransferase